MSIKSLFFRLSTAWERGVAYRANLFVQLIYFVFPLERAGLHSYFNPQKWSSCLVSCKTSALHSVAVVLERALGRKPRFLSAASGIRELAPLLDLIETVALDEDNPNALWGMLNREQKIDAIYVRISDGYNLKKMAKACEAAGTLIILDYESRFFDEPPNQNSHVNLYSPAETLISPDNCLIVTPRGASTNKYERALMEYFASMQRSSSVGAMLKILSIFLGLYWKSERTEQTPKNFSIVQPKKASSLEWRFLSNLSPARLEAFFRQAAENLQHLASFCSENNNEGISVKVANPTSLVISTPNNENMACNSLREKVQFLCSYIEAKKYSVKEAEHLKLSVRRGLNKWYLASHYKNTIVTPGGGAELIEVVDRAAYEVLTSKFPNNLLQDWSYGEAKRCEGWVPKRYLIRSNGVAVGAVQVLEKSVLGVRVVRINRGPLCQTLDEKLRALYLLRKKYSLFSRAFVLICPEMHLYPFGDEFLKSLFFIRRPSLNYHSSVLDLSISLDALRKNLDGKWRNLLKNAEQKNIEVKLEYEEKDLLSLIQDYQIQQGSKGYKGIPELLLMELANRSPEKLLALSAFSEDVKMGTVILYLHQPGATYLIGMTSDEGKKLNVNTLLLWCAIDMLKLRGFERFDLGGMEPNSLPQITHFKRGLNGQEYKLSGEWI
ncbi:MAG TPA: GNAT family N-acetyltransferase [Methanosarcina sp.]|nr:GNAT family N-acetyltransferase [Methanosarcina sp.]